MTPGNRLALVRLNTFAPVRRPRRQAFNTALGQIFQGFFSGYLPPTRERLTRLVIGTNRPEWGNALYRAHP